MRKNEELTNPASCMNRARVNEMTFVLLARDICAPAVIAFWCQERVRLGKNQWSDPQIEEALECAREMEATQPQAKARAKWAGVLHGHQEHAPQVSTTAPVPRIWPL